MASTAEFRSVSPEQAGAIQEILGIPARSALAIPWVIELQESSLTLLRDGGEVDWQLPMDLPVIGLASLDDGQSIVAYDVGGDLSVIDARSGAVVQTLADANPSIGSLLTEGESEVFAAGGEVSVRVSVESGRLEVADEDALLGWVVDASSEDLFVATRSGIRVLDKDTGATRSEIGTPGFASARLLSYRNALVVGVDSSLTFVDQDLSRSSEIGTYPRPIATEPIADGGFLVVDGLGRLERWTMDPVEWQRIACDLIGRDLTSEEWSSFFSSEEYRPTCG